MEVGIRGYHCDAYAHVNNARYLELFEEARWRALEESGVGELAIATGLKFFIVNINIDFKRAVNNGVTANIRTHLGEMSGRKIAFEQSIYVGDELCTRATITFVLFDEKLGRAATLTSEITSWFQRFAP